MLLVVRTEGDKLNGALVDPRGIESSFSFQIEPNGVASGLIRIGPQALVMTIEALNDNMLAMGTVPLDANFQPVTSGARGFEFVRE